MSHHQSLTPLAYDGLFIMSISGTIMSPHLQGKGWQRGHNLIALVIINFFSVSFLWQVRDLRLSQFVIISFIR